MKPPLILPVAMLQKYHALPPRDRRALLILGVFLAAVIFWKGVWQPLENATQFYREAYAGAVTDYAWMKAQAPQLQTLQTEIPSPDKANAITVVTTTAQLFELPLSRIAPAQDGSIQVVIASAPFGRIISWLEPLQREHRIKAANVVFEKLPGNPGHVSAQLTLTSF